MIYAYASGLKLDGQDLRGAVLPLLQLVASSGQFQAAESHLLAGLVDRIEIQVVIAEDRDRLIFADVLQDIGQELCFGVIYPVLDTVLGFGDSVCDTPEGIEPAQRVIGGNHPTLHLRDEVLFENPVNAAGLGAQIAVIGHVRRGRQVQNLRADAERNLAYEGLEFW